MSEGANSSFYSYDLPNIEIGYSPSAPGRSDFYASPLRMGVPQLFKITAQRLVSDNLTEPQIRHLASEIALETINNSEQLSEEDLIDQYAQFLGQ